MQQLIKLAVGHKITKFTDNEDWFSFTHKHKH